MPSELTLEAVGLRASAVQILRGDPYGTSAVAVVRKISGFQLINSGTAEPCGKVAKPVWRIAVVAPWPLIDGDLVLDARTGRIVCTGLPSLS